MRSSRDSCSSLRTGSGISWRALDLVGDGGDRGTERAGARDGIDPGRQCGDRAHAIALALAASTIGRAGRAACQRVRPRRRRSRQPDGPSPALRRSWPAFRIQPSRHSARRLHSCRPATTAPSPLAVPRAAPVPGPSKSATLRRDPAAASPVTGQYEPGIAPDNEEKGRGVGEIVVTTKRRSADAEGKRERKNGRSRERTGPPTRRPGASA